MELNIDFDEDFLEDFMQTFGFTASEKEEASIVLIKFSVKFYQSLLVYNHFLVTHSSKDDDVSFQDVINNFVAEFYKLAMKTNIIPPKNSEFYFKPYLDKNKEKMN